MFPHVIFVLFTCILLQQVNIEKIARPRTTVSRVLNRQWTLRKFFWSQYLHTGEDVRSPMYKLFGDCRLDLLAKFCMEEDFLGAFFLDQFTEIFSLSLSDTSDRKLLFSQIHELRLSSCLQSDCVTLFQEKGCQENREDVNNFLLEYILEIPSQILGGMLRKNKKNLWGTFLSSLHQWGGETWLA